MSPLSRGCQLLVSDFLSELKIDDPLRMGYLHLSTIVVGLT